MVWAGIAGLDEDTHEGVGLSEQGIVIPWFGSCATNGEVPGLGRSLKSTLSSVSRVLESLNP